MIYYLQLGHHLNIAYIIIVFEEDDGCHLYCVGVSRWDSLLAEVLREAEATNEVVPGNLGGHGLQSIVLSVRTFQDHAPIKPKTQRTIVQRCLP